MSIEAKTAYVVADWKDTSQLINDFIQAIEMLGGKVYELSSFEGSDTYGFLISDKKLNKQQIKQLDHDL
jgi:hypothetical protein